MSLSAAPATSATTSATPVYSSQDNFFQEIGTDYTFSSSSVIPFSPSSSINSQMLTYDISKLSSPTCLALNEMALRMSLKLEDKNGEAPPVDAMVSVTNLWPAAMIRGIRLFIQEVEVSSTDGGLYSLRNFLSYMTGYGMSTKNGGAQADGFYLDQPLQQQNFGRASIGFMQRRDLFGSYDKARKFHYYNRAVPVFCPLLTDFSSCSLPLLPVCRQNRNSSSRCAILRPHP